MPPSKIQERGRCIQDGPPIEDPSADQLRGSCPDTESLAEYIRLLVKAGGDIDIPCGDELSTPLHAAADAGSAPIARFLLTRGARPDSRDRNGNTPAHYAAFSAGDDPSCLIALLEAGADPGAKSMHGIMQTPLQIASSEGKTNKALALLRAGADPNASEPKSLLSPLHLAATRNDAELCRILAEHGADLAQADAAGRIPADAATPGSPAALFLRGAMRAKMEQSILQTQTGCPSSPPPQSKPRI